MFTSEIEEWLNANQNPGHATYLKMHRDLIDERLVSLGIDRNGEIAYFYLNYGPFPVRGWYSLNEVEEIEQATTYARSQLGVPEDFLALTGIEGQGITLLERASGAIFDVEFGQFEKFAAGEMAPIATSFGAFLQRCKNSENALPYSCAAQREKAAQFHLLPHWP